MEQNKKILDNNTAQKIPNGNDNDTTQKIPNGNNNNNTTKELLPDNVIKISKKKGKKSSLEDKIPFKYKLNKKDIKNNEKDRETIYKLQEKLSKLGPPEDEEIIISKMSKNEFIKYQKEKKRKKELSGLIEKRIKKIEERIKNRTPKLTLDQQIFLELKTKEEPNLDDIVFIKEEKKERLLLNIKTQLGLFIKRVSKIFGILMTIVGFLALLIPFGIGAVGILIVAILTLIAVGIWIIGGVIAMVKGLIVYFDLISFDGVGMLLYRAGVAFILSWQYVFSSK